MFSDRTNLLLNVPRTHSFGEGIQFCCTVRILCIDIIMKVRTVPRRLDFLLKTVHPVQTPLHGRLVLADDDRVQCADPDSEMLGLFMEHEADIRIKKVGNNVGAVGLRNKVRRDSLVRWSVNVNIQVLDYAQLYSYPWCSVSASSLGSRFQAPRKERSLCP